jgi:hypothetical protein
MIVPYLNKPSIGYGIEKIDEFSGFYRRPVQQYAHPGMLKLHVDADVGNRME